MELNQIQSLEGWRLLESDVSKTYTLQTSVFNTEGIRITDSKNWSNKLCPAIKSLDKGQTFICAVAHMNMSNQAMQTKKYIIDECDAGLLKVVVPIFLNDEYLGVISGCGLLAEEGEVDVFAINKISGMDEQEIEHLSSDMPTITYKKARSACDYIQKKLDAILDHYKNPAKL
ncbi:PocR ligand-binding domain-containing protein [Desulfobacula sp.]|uniref:PocR ligand-binding domain-containing protein n=1 Tax=Desulfobacula sp. TaxID=2593537 RepID=UPI0026057E35|nr:PocR ligand-binding domain-containing protein [Desulfobacula sp.]